MTAEVYLGHYRQWCPHRSFTRWPCTPIPRVELVLQIRSDLYGVMLVIVLFCLPETLYVRPEIETSSNHVRPRYNKATFVDGLKIRDRDPDTSLGRDKFVLPTLRLALNSHIVFPALRPICLRSLSRVFSAKNSDGILSKSG